MKLMKEDHQWRLVGGTWIMTWSRAGFTAALHGQINPWLQPTEDVALHQGASPKRNNGPILSYYLTVWRREHVFSIEWGRDGSIAIHTFQRGDWEETLLAIE